MKQVWIGVAIGLILLVLAFGAAGFGHGTYIPAMIAASPLPLGLNELVNVVFALMIPALWGLFVWIARKHTGIFPFLMMAHYFAPVAYGVIADEPFPPIEKIEQLAPTLILFSLIYIAAHIWLWKLHLTAERESE